MTDEPFCYLPTRSAGDIWALMIDEPVDAEVLGTGVVPNCKTAQMKEHSRDKRFWEQVYILATLLQIFQRFHHTVATRELSRLRLIADRNSTWQLTQSDTMPQKEYWAEKSQSNRFFRLASICIGAPVSPQKRPGEVAFTCEVGEEKPFAEYVRYVPKVISSSKHSSRAQYDSILVKEAMKWK
jgi:hypothetical protein